MRSEIATITIPLPLKMGNVNCNLIKANGGYIMVDTGAANGRFQLETEIERLGCSPGALRLIVLTHGDFDHIGNAAYLRERLGVKIAMHKDDTGMAEHGDMFWNRKSGNTLLRFMIRVFFRFGKSNRFQPDIHPQDGDSLAAYGLNAKVLSIPGHSKGSIGILTADGDLFCGDLLENNNKPALNSILDDPGEATLSVKKLRSYTICWVYPGHGKPFQMDELL